MVELRPPTLRLGPAPFRIVGSGAAFPADEIATAALLDRLAAELPEPRRKALAAFVDAEIGVHARAHLASGVARDLAAVAAREALAVSGVGTPSAIVYATSTPSRWTAAESALLARDLGLSCAFFDVRSGCTGGLHAIVHAARLVRDTNAPVLVVAADAFSKTFGNERLLPLSMGDGAGALVLAPSGDGGLVRAVFGGEGAHVDLATVPASLPPRSLNDAEWSLSGDPSRFAELAEAALSLALRELDAPDEGTLVVHTGRAATARRVAGERAPYLLGLEQHGNLGAPSLLVALHRLLHEREPAPFTLVSAGGGLSYGAALIGAVA